MSDRNKNLEPRIEALLAGLRWRIRAYVWLEGISLALIWFGLTFWIGLALDYLPVLAGASEMPREARAVVLLVIAAVLAWIMYRWVFRRALVPLTNRSMALLLERQFRSFDDSLVTSVELTEQPSHAEQFDPRMLQQTEDEARDNTGVVRLRQVFNFNPLLRSSTIAAVLLATIVAFYALNSSAMALWVNRIYLLRDEPWPRNSRIEVVGIELLGAEDAPQRPTEAPLVPFDEGQSLKVAKGSNVRLRVRADLGAAVIPEVCTFYYTTSDGERGRATMNRLRRSRGEFQEYAFNGKPLRGILSTVYFDVVGYDYRVRDFKIEVVDSPAVIATELDCRFPDYLVDEKLSLWLPRTEPLTSATQLPRGTDVTIRVLTNKPLRRVDLYNPDTKELTTQNVQGDEAQRKQFEYRVPELADNLTLDVTLFDVDNVVTERPYRIFLAAVPDEPPRVDIKLRGISTAVTPDVIIPVEGVILDDYAVDRTWFDFEMQRPGLTPDDQKTVRQSHDFSLLDAGRVDAAMDFRALRSQETEPLELQPADKLVFSVKAADKHDLSGGPNVGSSDRYQLDVVTPDMLLAILESREIGQRRRLEQILEEMTQARDFLNRVHSAAPGRGLEPGDVLEAADETDQERPDPQRLAERNQSLRLLRTQQAYQQGRKSGQELLGVATAFRDIREELINNRVDTEDRKQRLKELIADPMQLIAETMFPELDRRIEQLEKLLAEAMNKRQFDLQMGEAEAKAAVEQANDILAELEAILQQMLDLETFNELLDIVRQLIKDQQGLIEKTETERKQGLLRDLQ
jgi:hypothetical protein